jgi:hypothetical protein
VLGTCIRASECRGRENILRIMGAASKKHKDGYRVNLPSGSVKACPKGDMSKASVEYTSEIFLRT